VLKALMNIPPDSPDWYRRIITVDEPEFIRQSVDVGAAVRTALDHRTDVRAARLQLDNRETEAARSRNQMRHQLDVVGSYTSTGNNFDRDFVFVAADIDMDGTVAPGEGFDDVMTETQSRSESFSEIADMVNEDWSLRLEWSYAVGNRAARAEYSRARIAVDQAELSLLKAEQTVRVDVRRAVRALQTDAKRVEAARANVRLQEKKVEAEQKKYENGMSTSFEVLTFQNDLASAEFSLISAYSDWNKSLTGLAHATGTLLDERGLRLEPAVAR
jgi:outer membrane protein TolC